MAISDANKTKMNKMNRVAKDTLLGNVIQNLQNDTSTAGSDIISLESSGSGISGSLSVSLAQESASAVEIYSPLFTKGTYLYNISASSGSNVDITGFINVRSGGSLTITPADTGGSFTQRQVINYIIS